MNDVPGNPDRIGQEIATWPDRLSTATSSTRFNRVRVVASCDSTQDVARELGIGAVVTAGRQHAGRGRPGRTWLDNQGAGLAVSVVVESRSAARLCTATVLSVIDVVDRLTGAPSVVGAKFPNDVVHPDGRKLAGVLIEADGKQSVIGIGVNVHASELEMEFSSVSIQELGLETTRIDVLELLLQSLENRLESRDAKLSADFSARHVLLNRQVQIVADGQMIEGVLKSADPFGSLEIDSPDGLKTVSAAHAPSQAWSSRPK